MRSSCELAVEGHPSHDPAETKSTHRGHFLLSFDIRAQFPWEEREACLFCWGLFHFTLEKKTINIVLPYILRTDNAGIAWRWKEKVLYCHPGRWHMKLSLDACFEWPWYCRGKRGMETGVKNRGQNVERGNAMYRDLLYTVYDWDRKRKWEQNGIFFFYLITWYRH